MKPTTVQRVLLAVAIVALAGRVVGAFSAGLVVGQRR
jgi:hypothetical protein